MRAPTLLLLLLVHSAHAADWPMLAHDPARSGVTPDEIRPPFTRKWYRAFPDEGINSGVQPIIAAGKVFIPTLHGTLHALDAETGRDLWTFKAPAPLLHSPAVAHNKVYLGCADGHLYALNLPDGSFAWKLQTQAAIWNSPLPLENLVLVGSRDGALYAADPATGALKWSAPTAGPILSSPAFDAKSNRVYVGSESMHVHAFNATTGKEIWKSPKLPGATLRGYHPVIAPDGSVMITSSPVPGPDTIQSTLLDMTREVFGDFASWRHKKPENDKLRAANFALMQNPETYPKQLAYLRKRLTDQPAFQTFFVLDPATGQPKFTTPIVHAESMAGPTAPPLVLPNGKVIIKYSALLRSRYEHYSPFLNVGYLDTATGQIVPLMDESRTYGWHDSLLLVHDEQSQLSAAGRVLINTHQDNVNALDLDTLKGYPNPFALNVHEVKPGTANSLWSIHRTGQPLPVGWEWFARGTAVYGGGSVLDVPVSIANDSFYFLPTHELNAGVTVIAYKMSSTGNSHEKNPEPTNVLTPDQFKTIRSLNWDWDTLEQPRLNTTLQKNLLAKVPGTRQQPLTEQATQQVSKIPDATLNTLILTPAYPPATIPPPTSRLHTQLASEIEELLTSPRPLQFPAAKAPSQSFRFFIDPTETLYTFALAYPHLPPNLQAKVRTHIATLSQPNGPLTQKTYNPNQGPIRSLYDPAPDSLLNIQNDLIRSDTARLYPLYLYAQVTHDWTRLHADWPALKKQIKPQVNLKSPDLANADLAGLLAACRIAQHEQDAPTLATLLPPTRNALRARLTYELAHTEGGLITPVANTHTILGRWHFLTPDLAAILRAHALPIHQHLMDVYITHHRPTWFLAWNVELMWRNEAPFSFPTMSSDIFAAKALILHEPNLQQYLDLPWCLADEYHIQKLALTLNALQN